MIDKTCPDCGKRLFTPHKCRCGWHEAALGSGLGSCSCGKKGRSITYRGKSETLCYKCYWRMVQRVEGIRIKSFEENAVKFADKPTDTPIQKRYNRLRVKYLQEAARFVEGRFLDSGGT